MEEKKENVIKAEEGEKKLTFQAWLKGIAHYKWWVVGGTVALGLVGALGVQFGVNPLTEKLSANYNYNLATITDENGVERYVDGSAFNYASITSRWALQHAKDSDPKFAKINIDKIIKESAITVNKSVEFKTDSSGNAIPDSKSVKYTIEAVAKYFPSKEIGKEYLEKLIYLPQVISSDAVNRYNVTSYIGSSFANDSYIKRVNALSLQRKGIEKTYSDLDDAFGPYVIANEQGQTLNQVSVDFASAANNVQLLINSFYANGFVDYVSGSEEARIEEIKHEADANAVLLDTKQNELDVALDLLKTMQSATIVSTLQSESEYSKELIKLKNTITTLSTEVDQLIKDLHWAGYFYNETTDRYEFKDSDTNNACYQLDNLDADWVARNTAFGTSLNEAAEVLKSEVNDATGTFRYVYNGYKNSVSIFNSGYFEIKGNIHWAIGLVGGLILGFLVSSFVTGEVEVNYKKKEVKESK